MLNNLNSVDRTIMGKNRCENPMDFKIAGLIDSATEKNGLDEKNSAGTTDGTSVTGSINKVKT